MYIKPVSGPFALIIKKYLNEHNKIVIEIKEVTI